MSTLKVNSITNNGSAVDLPNGAFQIGGNDIVQGYTESASEPSSPTKGDLWWDTDNENLYKYLNGEFKEIGIVPSGWTVDLSNVTYDSVSFSVASQETNATALTLSADGTKMYVGGNTSDKIYQYSLSTAFDLSTASYDSVSLASDSIQELYFSTDGTKLFYTTTTTVFQYSLSTAFDLSTASYDSVSKSVSSQETSVRSLAFNDDGTKMYVAGSSNDTVYQYALSTAFDLSTASYDSVSFSVSSVGIPYGIRFNTDGTKMYIQGNTSDQIYQYSLSTGFDVSTASSDGITFSVVQDPVPESLTFSADGSKMYVLGLGTGTVYQYSTGL